MTILDRYIASGFAKLFIMCCFILTIIFVMFNFVDNLDKFFGDAPLKQTLTVFVKYYFFNTFPIIDLFLPLLFIAASILFLRGMDQGNEIIALMASGVSRFRLLMPLYGTALFFAILFFVIREIFIPIHLLDMVKTPEDHFRAEEAVRVLPAEDSLTGLRLSGDLAYTKDQRVDNPVVILPPELSQKTQSLKIAAKVARWRPAQNGLPQGWLLSDVFAPKDITKSKSIESDNIKQNVILTPADYPNILKPNECFVVNSIPFDVYQLGETWMNYAPIPKIVDALVHGNLNFNRQKLEYQLHSRILRPLTDIIPLFICIPLTFFRFSRNLSKNILIAVFITFVYLGAQFVTQFLGNYIDPILAAWSPVLIFAPIGYTIFYELIISPKNCKIKKKLPTVISS